MLTIFVIDIIIDWEGAKKSFKDGYNDAFYSSLEPKLKIIRQISDFENLNDLNLG